MENKKFQKIKGVPLAIQKYNIKEKYRAIIIEDNSSKNLNITLKMQPSEFSKEYLVLIYQESIEKKPKVYVCLDELEITEEREKDIPHKYGITNINNKKMVEICLFYREEWKNSMNISDTIIPWASEWLYFFEFWKITNEWCGGGKHPKKKDIKNHEKE